jgi:GNAT superfamily N-acetyltransferase
MRDEAIRYWSRFFGVTAEVLEGGGVHVVPHVGLADYVGAWIFWHGEAVIVSAPGSWVDELRPAAGQLARSAPDPDLARRLFGEAVERCIGPAYQGYLEPGSFRPRPHERVRRLAEGDGSALVRLREACGETAWEHASIDPESGDSCWGLLENGELIAAAQCEVWVPGVVSPGVLTHPAHRGRGCARAVVSAAAAEAISRGDLVLYQTLLQNEPALRVARALGFRQLATHVAVRLRA